MKTKAKPYRIGQEDESFIDPTLVAAEEDSPGDPASSSAAPSSSGVPSADASSSTGAAAAAASSAASSSSGAAAVPVHDVPPPPVPDVNRMNPGWPPKHRGASRKIYPRIEQDTGRLCGMPIGGASGHIAGIPPMAFAVLIEQ